MPSLFIVSTPIGNLGDLSHRAVEVLRAVDVILAEDTRRTGVLLRHFGIENAAGLRARAQRGGPLALVVELLGEGKDVALVSDAGTPLLSDPGARLVASALEAGYEVVPIPGASALLAALVASGLSADRFTFYGFLPRKGGERDGAAPADRRLGVHQRRSTSRRSASARCSRTSFRSPARERRVAVARELTKLHEEMLPRDAGGGGGALPRADGERGDRGGGGGQPLAGAEARRRRKPPRAPSPEALLAQGLPPSAVAKELRDRLGIPRNEAYRLVQDLADEG